MIFHCFLSFLSRFVQKYFLWNFRKNTTFFFQNFKFPALPVDCIYKNVIQIIYSHPFPLDCFVSCDVSFLFHFYKSPSSSSPATICSNRRIGGRCVQRLYGPCYKMRDDVADHRADADSNPEKWWRPLLSGFWRSRRRHLNLCTPSDAFYQLLKLSMHSPPLPSRLLSLSLSASLLSLWSLISVRRERTAGVCMYIQ